MKNKVHEDTKKMWKYREKVLTVKSERLKNYYARKIHRITRRYNACIPLEAKIHMDGVITPHGLMGIFISKGAEIGANCTIFQNVTIGSNTLPDSKKNGSPKIGNNVFIGANAVLIGDIKIGNGVRIGAGCTVFEDIPENATVVSEKPRVICHEKERMNKFIPVKKNQSREEKL